MDVASQAITIHTLSKYLVDVACLLEIRFPHFRSGMITANLVSSRGTGYISNNSGRNGAAIVLSEKGSFHFD